MSYPYPDKRTRIRITRSKYKTGVSFSCKSDNHIQHRHTQYTPGTAPLFDKEIHIRSVYKAQFCGANSCSCISRDSLTSSNQITIFQCCGAEIIYFRLRLRLQLQLQPYIYWHLKLFYSSSAISIQY